jgi:hypothetical protein
VPRCGARLRTWGGPFGGAACSGGGLGGGDVEAAVFQRGEIAEQVERFAPSFKWFPDVDLTCKRG